MSTFLLLTITGLGLGAMYFLIAVGAVAHLRADGRAQLRPRRVHHGRRTRRGGRRVTCSTASARCSGASCSARSSVSSLGVIFAALVELVLIRPLYGRHIEQVLVTVGLARRSSRWSRASWGRTRRVFWCRRGSTRRRRRRRAHPERPLDRDPRRRRRARAPAALPAPHALRADRPRRRREPRDGDRRSASTFARRSRSSSRSAASQPRSPACSAASTSTRSTRAGDEPADLRVHRRRDRRPRLDRRHGGRGGDRRARPAVRELLRLVGDR